MLTRGTRLAISRARATQRGTIDDSATIPSRSELASASLGIETRFESLRRRNHSPRNNAAQQVTVEDVPLPARRSPGVLCLTVGPGNRDQGLCDGGIVQEPEDRPGHGLGLADL